MAFAALLLATLIAPAVFGQSNYANHGNSVEFNPGLPDQATLDGKVTKLDELSPVIFLNRTKAALNCAAGTMEAELKFEEPFYGIAFADFNRNSPCFVAGNGNMTYRIEMPLKGCGTKQDPQRVFTNNIIVRFHPSLEMDGDEVITIVCRYPPPIAPVPAGLPDLFVEGPPAPIVEPPLKGFQILLVVCAILFLSLVLLGLGASYYCLSRRRLAVIRRRPATASLAGSEITKLSGSTLGSISLFEGLKIPRAAVTAAAAPSSSLSGSEAALIIDDHSDTIPSDYPSESPSSAHSEVEAATTVRRPPSEMSSVYDNSAFADESMLVQNQIITPPPPQFDVSVRVKRAAPTPPPRAGSVCSISTCSTPPPPLPVMPPPKAIADTATIEAMKIQERNLTTILEREDKLATPSPIPMASAQYSIQPEIQPTVTITSRPPVYSRIMRRQKEEPALTRRDSLTTLNTEMTDTHSVSEIMEETPQLTQLEPPVVALRKPEITQHVVDDVFLRTITEKRIIEDIERRKREVTEFHARIPPPPPPVHFDVAIRTYPDPNTPQDWDRYSTASSSTLVSEIQPTERYRAETNMEPSLHATSQSEHYRSSIEVPIPPPETAVPNWDVLIRVLEPPETFTSTYNIEPDLHSPHLVHQVELMDDDKASICSSLASVLTEEDRQKWRQIITTESTLRTLLTEAVVREDYERIRKDQRYEKLFEPQKWDVIIRVLAPPADEEHIRMYEQRTGATKYRKTSRDSSSNWDNRSRRSSLPTLYEFDSDAASAVSTSNNDRPPKVETRSRKTSHSSMRSDMDVRSMSEFTVNDQYRPDDFAYSDVSGPTYRYDDDNESVDSQQHPGSLMRSVSQPSLARSASEFTERRWALESNVAGDLMASSPEQTPVLSRRAKSSELLLLTSESTSSYTARSTTAMQYHENWGRDSETSFK